MKTALGLTVVLIAFWLLLSGHYTGFVLSMGALSIALVVWLARRMDVVDQEVAPVHFTPRLLLYWLWLSTEIIKSTLDVTRRVLRGPLALYPAYEDVTINQGTAMSETILANSITLTPGTLAVVVGNDTIRVHTVHKTLIEDLRKGRMAARVKALEPRGTREPKQP